MNELTQPNLPEPSREQLMPVVPQTYGEAILLYPWLKCENHEWDNRRTEENAVYLITELHRETEKLRRELEVALKSHIRSDGHDFGCSYDAGITSNPDSDFCNCSKRLSNEKTKL